MSHVLLIEADPTARRLLEALIELHGLTSSTATTAAEAIQATAAEPFDAILLDLNLPNGHIARLVKELRDITDAPVIVLAAQANERILIAALDAGANDFISNPLIASELFARLRIAIRRRPPPRTMAVDPKDAPVARRPMKNLMIHQLINLLQSREAQLVRNDEIIRAIWGAEKRDGGNVRVLVTMARRTLKAEGDQFEIVTDHGRGYRLCRRILLDQRGPDLRSKSASRS